MAGFRLWEQVTIDDLLDHLGDAIVRQVEAEFKRPVSDPFKKKLYATMKGVLNEDMYASPACGTSVICRPSEEVRMKPWSRRAKEWGLVRGTVED
jgi:hypothetical protein